MRVAVLSDIHSIWHAMKAALEDADAQGAAAIWCLGDVTGYGPFPFRCWQELALPGPHNVPWEAWVAGNHDWGVIERLESRLFKLSMKTMDGPEGVLVGDFAEHAWQVIRSHRTFLKHKPEMLETLKGLPVLASPCAGVYLAHGRFIANARKAIGAYAEVPDTADTSLGNLLVMLPHLADISWGEIPRLARDGWQAPRLMLVGHTHKACAWQPRDNRRDGARWLDRTAEINAGPVWFEDLQDRPVFANPGSVGFPRDCTPGFATYMLVDWQETAVGLWLRRVQYDPTETIQTMRNVGTPELVIQQLEPRNRGARPSVI